MAVDNVSWLFSRRRVTTSCSGQRALKRIEVNYIYIQVGESLTLQPLALIWPIKPHLVWWLPFTSYYKYIYIYIYTRILYIIIRVSRNHRHHVYTIECISTVCSWLISRNPFHHFCVLYYYKRNVGNYDLNRNVRFSNT